MRRVHLAVVAVVGLALSGGVPGAAAQVIDQSTLAQQPKPSSTENQPMQRMDLKDFVGKLVKAPSGNYVLVSSSTMITYEIDNQKLAKEYAYQEVTVIGQLLPPGNMIHVQRITRAPE